MNNKKSEGDDRATTSVTTQGICTKCGTIWTTPWFFQNFKCDRPFAATISGYGRYRPNYIQFVKAKFENFNRNDKKNQSYF
jgi:hypothetical protein